MVKYLTPEEIQKNRKYIQSSVQERQNYFIREGIVQNVLETRVPKDALIVEAGAGGGRLASELLGRGYKDLHLVDIDNYLPENLSGKITFYQSDVSFNPLPFKDKSVDVVLAIAIVEHLENSVFIIREAARVLKPGGLFLVAIPWIFSFRSRLDFLFRGNLSGYNLKNNHISLFSNAVFQKLFLKHFKIAETHFDKSYVRVFGRKFLLPIQNKWLGEHFSDKSLFVFQK